MDEIVKTAMHIASGLAGKAGKDRIRSLLVHLIVLQDQQRIKLSQIMQQNELLLRADFNAAKQHLEYAALEGRDPATVKADISKARDLFIRALGQAPNLAVAAVCRMNIAICAMMLKDKSIAAFEAKKASDQIEYCIVDVQHHLDLGQKAEEGLKDSLKSAWIGRGELENRWQKIWEKNLYNELVLRALIPMRDAIHAVCSKLNAEV